MRLLSLLAALTLCAAMPDPLKAAVPDTARLRAALAAEFGDDVRIVRTELRDGLPERSGTFWLVHARPRRSGDYQLRYRYDYQDIVHPQNPLYTHVEHTSWLRVGERGCWRRREGRDVCVGDTVILPIVATFSGHTFHVTRQPLSGDAGAPPPDVPWGVDTTGSGAIPNPLARHLRYVGFESAERLRANGGGTVSYSATFQAVAPGRFNLAIGSRESDEAPPALTEAGGSMPVIIVPRGQPVTVLLERETVVGRNETSGFSSHSDNEYLTTVLILQPGDRITLGYGARALLRPGGRPPPGLVGVRESRRHTLEPPVPVIAGFPFRMDAEERFNAWIAPHLP